MKISRCIAAALLVGSTTAGCSSCAKDDAPANKGNSDSPPMAMTDRKASGMPRYFERRPPQKIDLAPGMLDGSFVTPGTSAGSVAPPTSAVADAGTDATTH